MSKTGPIVVALVLHESRLAEWLTVLGTAASDNVQVVGCPTLDSIRAARPEIVVGHQEGALLDYIADPFPNLRWVQLLSAGVDRAMDRLRGRAVTFRITRAGGIHAGAMREYAMTAMLHFCKDVPKWESDQAKRAWQPSTPNTLVGRNLLIVGTGAIGAAIAKGAVAFEMNAIGVSRHGRPVPPFSRVEHVDGLHPLLPTADYIVLAAPLTAATRRMIDASCFAAMKPGVVLINVARGALIDESALIEALRSGKLAGAALDAFETEPLPLSSPLWHAPNILLTPHVSGRFAEGHTKARAQFVANLASYIGGGALAAEVDIDRGY
jgi:phosphoglycerate dehydrogenase-like enzyme